MTARAHEPLHGWAWGGEGTGIALDDPSQHRRHTSPLRIVGAVGREDATEGAGERPVQDQSADRVDEVGRIRRQGIEKRAEVSGIRLDPVTRVVARLVRAHAAHTRERSTLAMDSGAKPSCRHATPRSKHSR